LLYYKKEKRPIVRSALTVALNYKQTALYSRSKDLLLAQGVFCFI